MSTLSWQAGTASGPFLVGTLIQSCAVIMYPEYEPTNWQATLMVIGVTAVVWGLNIWGADLMPIFQNVMLVFHVFGFLATIVVLWVLSPRSSAEVTFKEFKNYGGWNSQGLSLMVGQIAAIYACICKSAIEYHVSVRIEELTYSQAPTLQHTCPKKPKTLERPFPALCWAATS